MNTLPRSAGAGAAGVPHLRQTLAAHLARLVRGRAADPAWLRPAQIAVAALAAGLYLWGLGGAGYGNSYYAAAVLAGTKSWKAFFFGSFDAGNFITVDKPPVFLWVMDLSARIFGFNSWSMLVPEALAGVATVLLVGYLVRRASGPVAGVVAALVVALTPVVVVMFRYNNPDALLTLLLVLAAWALIRGLETGRTRWLLLSAGIVGLAFDTKDLEAYVVLPALAVTYFLFGPGGLGRRMLQLVGAAGALVASSLWWPVTVDLIPASARPYVAGSSDNSVLNLVFGYNGFGRITGQEFRGPGGGRPFGGGTGSGFGALFSGNGGLGGFLGTGSTGGGGFGFRGFGGQPGLLRMFGSAFGGQISWLIPLALAGLVAGLWMLRGRPRTDVARAGLVLWGVWLLTEAVVFSFASGIVHPYYSVVMGPAIGALVGAGLVALWQLRSESWPGRLLLAAAVAGTAWWGYVLLARTPGFLPALGSVELALAIAAAVVLVVPTPGPGLLKRRLPLAALAMGAAALLIGPTAYAGDSVARSRGGPTPTAGPGGAGFGPGFGGGGRGIPDAAALERQLASRGIELPPGAFARASGGGRVGFGPVGLGGGPAEAGARAFGGRGGRGFGEFGGLSTAAERYLVQHQGSATWIVAMTGANAAAPVELATGKPVMAMGGFSGSDPTPTVSQLRSLISAGRLRYVMVGGRGGFAGGGSLASARTTWVTQHCAPVRIGFPASGSASLYDCSGAGGG